MVHVCVWQGGEALSNLWDSTYILEVRWIKGKLHIWKTGVHCSFIWRYPPYVSMLPFSGPMTHGHLGGV